MTNEKNIVDYIVPVDELANKKVVMRIHFNPNNCEIEYATEYEMINGKINPKHIAAQYRAMGEDDPQLKHDMELMRKYAVCTANGHCPCDCPND
jgi:hypothetical protein